MSDHNELAIYQESRGDIIRRLVWIVMLSLLCFTFVAILAFLLPSTPQQAPPPADPDMPYNYLQEVGWRVGAGLLLAHQCALLLLQIAAPDSVLKAKLVSNSFLCLLIPAVSAFACLLLFSTTPFGTIVKLGLLSAYSVPFVASNLIVSIFIGAVYYRLRRLKLADANELFWVLGSLFLLGILIWLISKSG